MVSILPIAVTGGIISSGFVLSRKRKSGRLIKILVDTPTLSDAATKRVAYPTNAPQLFQMVTAQLARVDDRYQQFVQQHVDPLLGKTCHGQLQEMLGEEPLVLSRDERLANRRFGMGMASLTLSLVGQ